MLLSFVLKSIQSNERKKRLALLKGPYNYVYFYNLKKTLVPSLSYPRTKCVNRCITTRRRRFTFRAFKYSRVEIKRILKTTSFSGVFRPCPYGGIGRHGRFKLYF